MVRSFDALLVVLVSCPLAVIAVACTKSELSIEDYDTSCSADGDCVTATFGDPCKLPCNPNGAIRNSEKARYLNELSTSLQDCPQVNYVADPCSGSYRDAVARCVSGTCKAVDVTGTEQDAGPDGGP